VNLIRHGRAAAVLLAGALALAACGSDNNNSGGGSTGSSTGGSIACQSGSIKASGSSAQKNAMTTWINTYQEACSGATINYSPSGSGAGVQDFQNNQTAFAGSDSAIKDADLQKANARCGSGNQAINLPMVVGPIAVAYNLPNQNGLVFTPSVLAKIFSGTITKWNDPAITALNSGATLPSATIVTFHRSDSSGTTDNFTKYLTAAAGSDWTFSHDKVWKAPGGQGAKGSDGVAAALKSTPNSLGYVEYSFTQEGGLEVAKIDNGGGAVELTPENAATAVAAAQVTGTAPDLTLSLDYATKTAGAYPIVLVTYEITCNKGLPADQLKLTKSFLTYTASDAGQSKLNAQSGYAPLPKDLDTKVQASVAGIS
jgi:phosphate transport system substrate-binding protein